LDASLVFGRDAQPYLLSLLDGSVSAEIQSRAGDGLATYLGGISRALFPERRFLVGEGLTLADICFVAELALFSNERARRDPIAATPYHKNVAVHLAPVAGAEAEAAEAASSRVRAVAAAQANAAA